MVTFSPASGAATGLKGGGIDNLVLVGYGVAGTGLQMYSMRGGIFPRLTIENVTSAALDMNSATTTIGDGGYDNQDNYFGQLLVILYWNVTALRNANGIVLERWVRSG